MGRRIAVNTRLLLANKLEGIGTFTAETLKIIVKENPTYEFHFIFDRPFDPQFIFGPNVTGHVIAPPVRHPLLAKIWYNFSLKRKLRKINPDVFVSPDAMTSLTTKIKSLVVIHDLNFVHRPNDLPKKWSVFYNQYTPKFIGKAKRIATVSEFSKQDIITTYGVSNKKIDVVYNGVKTSFTPINKEETSLTTNPITKGSPYFFYIGSLHPRKNIKNLLIGFDEFKKMDQGNHKLIIGGNVMWNFSDIENTLSKLASKKHIHFTGRLTDHELNNYMCGAVALTYIPFFEGFGIPILEAMACNTPVITSNVTSLPEVAGEAAYLVSPNSISEISSAMLELSTNSELKENLIIKGQERLKEFTWEKSASLLWKSILKTLEE